MKAKQFLVIGAGRFGSALATTLYGLEHEVVLVDIDEERLTPFMNLVTHAMIADATEEAALEKLGVSNFDQVVVAIGNDLEANILATVAAKGLGAKQVISKATTALSAKVLKRVGADEVVRPEHDMGVRLAQQLSTPSLVDAFKLGDDYGVIEVESQTKLCGTLLELNLTNRFGVQVIVVDRDGKLTISPKADFELREGDNVVLIGNNRAVARFRAYLSS